MKRGYVTVALGCLINIAAKSTAPTLTGSPFLWSHLTHARRHHFQTTQALMILHPTLPQTSNQRVDDHHDDFDDDDTPIPAVPSSPLPSSSSSPSSSNTIPLSKSSKKVNWDNKLIDKPIYSREGDGAHLCRNPKPSLKKREQALHPSYAQITPNACRLS